MACLDDADFIISMIRHSCVTSDDTGMCEMVIVDEEHENVKFQQRRRLRGKLTPEERNSWECTDYSQSFDIAVSPDLGVRTPSQIRGFVKKDMVEENKCKKISWKDNTDSVGAEELQDLFNKRVVTPSATKQKKVSMLSVLLKESTDKPVNQFREYSKFDGEAYQGTCETKTLKIFLTMLQDEERDIPMPVTVLGTASVEDLTGLILYKYVQEDREPQPEGDVSSYCLQIAEDDGEVDMDFSPLDDQEPITKFGFGCLALVEKEREAKVVKVETVPTTNLSSLLVKVHEIEHGYITLKVDSFDIKMKDILAKMIKKRGLKRTGHEYVLVEKTEKPGTPGRCIDLEETLQSMGTNEFTMVKANSKRAGREDKISSVQATFTSHQYKSYRINTYHKLRTGTEIQLGVYGEKIEIDPVMQPKTAKFWRQKAVSWSVDRIADCCITESKSTGRCIFKIVHFNNHEYKHHHFEADFDIAEEIVTKINHILESRVSTFRTEYKGRKGDRSRKRHGTPTR